MNIQSLLNRLFGSLLYAIFQEKSKRWKTGNLELFRDRKIGIVTFSWFNTPFAIVKGRPVCPVKLKLKVL